MRWVFLLLITTVAWPAASVADLLRQAEDRIQKDQFTLAEPLLRQVLKQEPNNVDALYRLGYVQYRRRSLAEAKSNFLSVIKLAPPAHHSRYFLGRIALMESKPLDAIRWLEPVVAGKQAVFDASSQLATAYAAAGQPRKALAPMRAAIAESPWDSSLYYRLGRLYRQLGQSELAREAFENSSRLKNANRADVELLMRASQAATAGRTAEALEAGATILNRADAEPNALVALGVIYGNAQLQAEALRAFEQAARADSKFFQAQFNYGLALLRSGRTADAMAPLSAALTLLPQSVEANTTYGLASVMNRQYENAVEPLERAWGMDSSNARVASLLATAYLRTGNPSKAVPVLRDAAGRDSSDPAPALLLIEALNAAEDTAGALEAARLTRQRFPKLTQAHLALAQQLIRAGRYEEARPAFEEILKLEPGMPQAELGLADTLQKAGEHSEAVPHYRAAIGKPGTDAASRVGLARSLIALRDLETARQVLEEGVAASPSDAGMHLELSRVYARLGRRDLAAEHAKLVERLRSSTPESR